MTPAQPASFPLLADALVEAIIGRAGEGNIEIVFCVTQIPGPSPDDGVAYLLRRGNADAWLTRDVRGRGWVIARDDQPARPLDSEAGLEALEQVLADVLAGPARAVVHIRRH